MHWWKSQRPRQVIRRTHVMPDPLVFLRIIFIVLVSVMIIAGLTTRARPRTPGQWTLVWTLIVFLAWALLGFGWLRACPTADHSVFRSPIPSDNHREALLWGAAANGPQNRDSTVQSVATPVAFPVTVHAWAQKPVCFRHRLAVLAPEPNLIGGSAWVCSGATLISPWI